MDYKPKFRFQWTWDGYNLIPLNPKAEELLSRIIDGVHVGNQVSHSWLINTGIFQKVDEKPPRQILFRDSYKFVAGTTTESVNISRQ